MKNNDPVLALYLRDINKIPLLTHDETIELAKQAQNGNKAAKDKIVTSNLRFVVNIAKQYQNNGLELTDLISEGKIGLVTAVEKFDFSKGYHFISYAVWWIKQSITKAISEKSRSIRLPYNRINDFNKVSKAKKYIKGANSVEEEITQIAQICNLDSMYIKELLLLTKEFISLDVPVSTSENGNTTVANFIEDKRESVESEVIENDLKNDIDDVLNTLKPNEQKVLRLRYGLDGDKPKSLKEIGDICNLTKERIRQIEKHAIIRLRHPVKARVLKEYIA